MRSIALGIALVCAAACSPAASADQPAAVPGSWHGQTSDMPPAVGHRVGLWLEYVPGTDPVHTQWAKSPAIAFTASCATCAPGVGRIEGITKIDNVAPEELNHADAVAAHSALITFPAAGDWHIEPFGMFVSVRPVAPYEPPMLHARPWSKTLPDGCSPERIAQILRSFIAGLNGDETALVSVNSTFQSLSLDGRPPRGLAAKSPAEVIELARALWRAGDRFELVRVDYSYPGGQHAEVGLAPVVIRTVRLGDRVESRRMLGKAGMWCTQGGMMHWNLDTSRSP